MPVLQFWWKLGCEICKLDVDIPSVLEIKISWLARATSAAAAAAAFAAAVASSAKLGFELLFFIRACSSSSSSSITLRIQDLNLGIIDFWKIEMGQKAINWTQIVTSARKWDTHNRKIAVHLLMYWLYWSEEDKIKFVL